MTALARTCAGALLAASALVACAGVQSGAVGPSPTPSASVTPAACDVAPTASVTIGISPAFGVVQVAPYGQIAGYADVTSTQPLQAGVVTVKTTDSVQFANLDPDDVTAHSAVGFPVTGGKAGFPAIPYTFPIAAASPSANTVIGNAQWSTGRIPASASGTPCLSQTFTFAAAGTYYFGDFDFYNTITSFRDAIVVQ